MSWSTWFIWCNNNFTFAEIHSFQFIKRWWLGYFSGRILGNVRKWKHTTRIREFSSTNRFRDILLSLFTFTTTFDSLLALFFDAFFVPEEKPQHSCIKKQASIWVKLRETWIVWEMLLIRWHPRQPLRWCQLSPGYSKLTSLLQVQPPTDLRNETAQWNSWTEAL